MCDGKEPMAISPDDKIRAWLKLKLYELREGMIDSLDELQGEGTHHLADLEELASDVTADGVVFEQIRSQTDTVALVEKALQRLDEGSYPTCEECGGEIGEARLAALPYASQCVDCKRGGEQSSASRVS